MSALPPGWSRDRLKDVTEINPSSLAAGTSRNYEFEYLEISNVDYFGVIDAGAIERVTFEQAPSRARRIVQKNCTVISSVRPNLQAAAHFPDDVSDFVCSTGFNVVKPAEKLHSRFLHYSLLSEVARQYFESTATGVGYPAVADKDFNSLSLVFPSYADQQRIATYLDASCAAIDAAVAAKRKQIETLDALEMSLIHDAVTKGLADTVPIAETGLDWSPEAPRHWRVRQIKRMCSIVRGQFTHRPRNDPALYDGPYPFIQTGDITAAQKYIRTYGQTLNELGLAASKQFPKGTLVMSIAANIGDVAILDFEACFPDSMVGLIPSHETDLHFLYYLMRAMRPIMLRSAVLSTQLNLNYVRIGTNFAAFPPTAEQVKIAAYLDAKEREVQSIKSALQRQIDTLTAYRKSLILECVTGQRRISAEDLAGVGARLPEAEACA